MGYILTDATTGAQVSSDKVFKGDALNAGVALNAIAIGVYGQSNEHGAVPIADRAAYPLTFASQRQPTKRTPLYPAVSRQGGWWHYVQDDLLDFGRGYDVRVVQGGIGGLGFIVQGGGRMQTWAANNSYYGKRSPQFPGDRGDFGDCIVVGTRIWNAIVGRSRVAVNSGSDLDPSGNRMSDFITFGPAITTGGTIPAALSTGAVGDTVTDGGITWKCLSITGTTSGPYVGALQGAFFTKDMYGYGFDPLNTQQRLHEAMQQVQATRKIIYIQNAQSDLGSSAVAYGAALQAIGDNFLDLGYEIMIGLSIYSPGSAQASAQNYDNLETGRQTAIANLSAAYPGKVFTGPNLRALMGSNTGPMASGGAYMQADNVHLSAQGCVGPMVANVPPAGRHVADAFRAMLGA